jgi:hypothetical protein
MNAGFNCGEICRCDEHERRDMSKKMRKIDTLPKCVDGRNEDNKSTYRLLARAHCSNSIVFCLMVCECTCAEGRKDFSAAP